MKYRVFSVEDTLVGHNAPFIMVSQEVAKREFTNMVKDNPNKDYLKLWEIGTFHEETGLIEGYKFDEQEMLMRGIDVGGDNGNN